MKNPSKKIYIFIILLLITLHNNKVYAGEYQIGSGIYDITGAAAESNMFGYANMKSTDGIQMRLFSRAYVIADEKAPSKRVVFVSADLGAIFQSVKLAVVERLQQRFGNLYEHDNVMLSATHTHVGSGGQSHYDLYMLAAVDNHFFGYSSQNFEATVNGIVESIERAHHNLAPGSIDLVVGELDNTTRNRSIDAYRKNHDHEHFESDTNKTMTLLRLTRDDGEPIGMINWFSIHPTSFSINYTKLSGDNKGYAQYLFEKDHGADHRHSHTFVAAFANSDEGDVVPTDGNAHSAPGWEGSADEYHNVEQAALKQYHKAKELYEQTGIRLDGTLEYIHTWRDFENFTVAEEYTGNGAQTHCRAARGFSFAAGGENGPSSIPGIFEGMTIDDTNIGAALSSVMSGSPMITAMQFLFGGVTLGIDDPCQHGKPNLLSTGALNLVPSVLPFQLFIIGELAIIGAPSEVTTMAGRRLRQTVINKLANMGIQKAVIAGLANTYTGYLTTQEEFQAQHYEGASNEFGQYTLAAYQQTFAELIQALINGDTIVDDTPPDLTHKMRLERPGVVLDGKKLFEYFGKVLKNANKSYHPGEQVEVSFRGGHPKNNLKTQDSFLVVQHKVSGRWVDYAYDWDWETEYHWHREGLARSVVDIIWRIPDDVTPGKYRILHSGHRKSLFGVHSYSGKSRTFTIK